MLRDRKPKFPSVDCANACNTGIPQVKARMEIKSRFPCE